MNVIAIDRDEFEAMLDRLHWLECLEDAGVDNWVGFDYARDLYNEDLSEGE